MLHASVQTDQIVRFRQIKNELMWQRKVEKCRGWVLGRTLFLFFRCVGNCQSNLTESCRKISQDFQRKCLFFKYGNICIINIIVHKEHSVGMAVLLIAANSKLLLNYQTAIKPPNKITITVFHCNYWCRQGTKKAAKNTAPGSIFFNFPQCTVPEPSVRSHVGVWGARWLRVWLSLTRFCCPNWS